MTLIPDDTTQPIRMKPHRLPSLTVTDDGVFRHWVEVGLLTEEEATEMKAEEDRRFQEAFGRLP